MTWRKNDVGGMPGGAIEQRETPVKFWQLESEALRKVLGHESQNMVYLDELRRCMEDLTQDNYDTGFYNRRILAITDLLIEKGVLTAQEVKARIEDLKQDRS